VFAGDADLHGRAGVRREEGGGKLTTHARKVFSVG